MLIDMTDRNQIWKDALLASRLTGDNYYDQEERAESYDKSESIRNDGERRVTALDPDPSWSVLDIGAGPGTLAIPLGRRVRRVTAVEPSGPMIRCLERHLAQEKLSNASIINSCCQKRGGAFLILMSFGKIGFPKTGAKGRRPSASDCSSFNRQ